MNEFIVYRTGLTTKITWKQQYLDALYKINHKGPLEHEENLQDEYLMTSQDQSLKYISVFFFYTNLHCFKYSEIRVIYLYENTKKI